MVASNSGLFSFIGGYMSKYNNKILEADGYKFASKLEYEYYLYLLEKQKQGIVESFEMQVPFILLDAYEVQGRKERPIKLVADFVIKYSDGREEVQDTKGFCKPVDIIKKKLFESRYKRPLIFIGKSIIDGGFVDHSIIKEGRKQRKKLKNKKD